MRLVEVAMLALSAVSCVKTDTRLCGDFVCAQNDVCTPDGSKCTSPLAITACQGKADGDACNYPGTPNGVCGASVCELGGCGNGVMEASADEVCDDGNRISGDGCSADCRSLETCGDGILNPGELCDCGVAALATSPAPGCSGFNSESPGTACRTDCKPQRCGDGVVDAPIEQCDDGNTTPGDGCAADCSGRWTKMVSNTLVTLNAVWGASPSDVWAVGINRIMRWNGTSWTRQPEIDSLAHAYSDVCGVSSTDVFVVTAGKVLRYSGSGTSGTWSTVSTSDTSYSWKAVFCRGTKAWIAGGYDSGASKAPAYGVWNGSTFSAATFQNTTSSLVDIWASTDDRLFGVDLSGYVWVAQITPPNWDPVGNQRGFYLAGTTSSDVVLTTLAGAARYDSSWALIPGSDELSGALAIASVPGTSPAQLLLVGDAGAILSCTSTACAASPSGTEQVLNGVWSSDATHAFIVGTHGTILY